ncbi:MAG: BlaI/MecI/CopY family transcriptional regulator [Oscillospiraceae bacterium]|jgi:BlaI family penicillinase repressor|nr:BlaI/MecI/CopY family transcriptional regulator [Oscillospiraceae bacterium]
MCDKMRLVDSELKVMEVLWGAGEMPARQVAAVLKDSTGWNVNTTYTLIKRCMEKGAVEREEPGFLCRALVSREQVQRSRTRELIDKVYGGQRESLFAALLDSEPISGEELRRLRALIDQMEARAGQDD